MGTPQKNQTAGSPEGYTIHTINKVNSSDTIAAISTPIGYGGIGIIKISGGESLAIAHSIFVRSRKLGGNDQDSRRVDTAFVSHQLQLGRIIDPQTEDTLDEVLLAFMQGPHSYTGEDVVEINSHSGPFLMRRILEVVLGCGARMAEPGEFTRRSFLNGRIDLTQAEAVAEIIHAKSQTALEIAVGQVQGKLRQGLVNIQAFLRSLQVHLEAEIDFAEDLDDNELDNQPVWNGITEHAIEPLEEVIGHYESGRLFRVGIRIAVIGKPNVGKSSLLNCFLQRQRAIVTEIPGTTRDIIEESLTIEGIPIVLSDTAGLRDTCDQIERLGIKKTEDCIDNADLILFMLDASCAVTAEDEQIFHRIREKHKVFVYNKIDLCGEKIRSRVPSDWISAHSVQISAKFNQGIEALKRAVVAALDLGQHHIGKDSLIPNLRQKIGLEECLGSVRRLYSARRAGETPELLALDLNEALTSLGRVMGQGNTPDVIERIFETFCVGK